MFIQEYNTEYRGKNRFQNTKRRSCAGRNVPKGKGIKKIWHSTSADTHCHHHRDDNRRLLLNNRHNVRRLTYSNTNNSHNSVGIDRGGYRVHGGGFAGTVQAFVPNDMLDEFKSKIDAVLGDGMCHVLSIRPIGGTEVL